MYLATENILLAGAINGILLANGIFIVFLIKG